MAVVVHQKPAGGGRMTFSAKIRVNNLRTAVSMLSIANDTVMVRVDDQGVLCRIQNVENTVAIQTCMPRHTNSWHNADVPCKFGVSLESLAKVLRHVPVYEDVVLTYDPEASPEISIVYGMHVWRLPVVAPEDVLSCPAFPDIYPNLPTTVMLEVQGGDFRRIVESMTDVGTLARFTSNMTHTTIDSESVGSQPKEFYHTMLPLIDGVSADAVTHCAVEHLAAVANNIMPLDTVTMRYARDYPVTLHYVRGGVTVDILIAPRMEV